MDVAVACDRASTEGEAIAGRDEHARVAALSDGRVDFALNVFSPVGRGLAVEWEQRRVRRPKPSWSSSRSWRRV